MGGGVWIVVAVTGQGGGMLLVGRALEISVVCFSSFQDGRGLEFGLRWRGGAGLGFWGSGSQPATAGSSIVSHRGKKKQSWMLPGCASAALQSPKNKTGTQK